MMPDHPTTGGYPCIGAVARTSLPLLAQAQPGIAEVVFYPVDENRAREDFQKAMMKLETQLEDQEALWPIA
jgi:allophanate hydrolase subunit 2